MLYPLIGLMSIFVMLMIIAMQFRVVVSTNDVHIVQRSKGATSYGAGQAAGNTYYRWPSWIPLIGVKVSVLPLSIFSITLEAYPAYDKGRVPFIVDIMAFFRIVNSTTAAARVIDFNELKEQLFGILQSACRSILARSEIEEILEGRSTFGDMFTKEVDHNLESWGLQSVKNIEIMDVRDASDSKVIRNIMAKKQSLIEKESRVMVATNMQVAKVAEIEATQIQDVRLQEAQENVGLRTATKDQRVGIAGQEAQQAIKESERTTAEKQMQVVRVQNVRQAEIAREVKVVFADQERQAMVISAEAARQTVVIGAEADKQNTILTAEGNLQHMQLNAQGIRAEGEARGAAETAVLMAPVTSQIALAEKISSDDGYQKYLVTIRGIERDQAVGVAQAEALKAADIKVIANTGDVIAGVGKAMDLFTSKGGTAVSAALEALSQTPTGKAVVDRLTGNGAATHG